MQRAQIVFASVALATLTVLTVTFGFPGPGTPLLGGLFGPSTATATPVSPTATPTPTATQTPTVTNTPTATGTATNTPTVTSTPTATPTTTAARISIVSPPVTGAASIGANLGPITVRLLDALGTPAVATGPITLGLSSSSTTGAVFSATQGGAASASITVASGSSSASFYYGDRKAGAPTITVSGPGLASASQTETVVAGAPSQLAFTSGAVMGTASTAASLGPLQIQLQDQLANPATVAAPLTVTLASSSGGTAVFAASQNGAAIASIVIGAGAGGASFYYGDTVAGTPTLTASAPGYAPATQLEQILAAPASKLVIVSSPMVGPTSSMAILGPIRVQLRDQLGNTASASAPVTVSLTSSSAGPYVFGATLGGAATTTVTIPAGQSGAVFYYGDTVPGTPTITASTPGLTPASQVETIQDATTGKLVILSPAVEGSASSIATLGPITVQLQTAAGAPLNAPTAVVVALGTTATGTGAFAASAGGPTITSVTIPAAQNSVSFYYGDTRAGSPMLSVSAPSYAGSTQTATIIAAAPAKLAFVTPPLFGPAGSTANLGPVTVQLQDAFSNAATSASATTILLTSSSPGGTFALTQNGASVTTAIAPAASSSVSFYYGDPVAGAATITVSSSGLASASQTATTTGGVPSRLSFASAPVSGRASDTASLGPLTVQALDQLGNRAPLTAATTLTLTSSSPSATFALAANGPAVTTLAMSTGQDVATFFYGDRAGGTPTLLVSAGGFTPAGQTATIAASKLAFVGPPLSAWVSSTANMGPITLQLQDQLANPASGLTSTVVTLSTNSAGATIFSASLGGAPITSVTIPAGQTSATFYYGDTTAGAPLLGASATGLATASQTMAVTSGKLAILSAPVSGIASNSANLGPITVQLQDRFGAPLNALSALDLTLNSSSARSAFASTQNGPAVTSVRMAAGQNTASFFYGDAIAGTSTIAVSGIGVVAVTQQETIAAGPPTKLVITSTPASGQAWFRATIGAIVVQLQDQVGNPVPAPAMISITPTSNSSGAYTFAPTYNGLGQPTLALAAGASNMSFFYGDQQAGTPIIMLAAPGLTPATQTVTVGAGPFSRVAITTPPLSGIASSTANTGPMTLELQDRFGNPTVAYSPATFQLNSNSPGTVVFSNSLNGPTVTSITVPAGMGAGSLYYGDTAAGSPTIAVTSPPLTSATQTATITAGAASQTAIMLPGQTLTGGRGITGTPKSQLTGATFDAFVYAVDPYYNIVASQTPVVAVQSTDPSAIVSAPAALVSGSGVVTVRHPSFGIWSLTSSGGPGTALPSSRYYTSQSISTFAGNGNLGSTGDGGPATSAAIGAPWGVAVDSVGNVYFSSITENVVRKVTPAGIISTVAGGGSGCPQQTNAIGDGCPATSATFASPLGIGVDGAGRLYIVDQSHQRVRVVDPVSGVISTFAGTGVAGQNASTNPLTALLNYPTSLAVTPSGDVYIGDENNKAVLLVSGGVLSTVITNAGTSGLAADLASKTQPYTANGPGNVVNKVGRFAGTGIAGFTGDGGRAIDANVTNPSGLAVDGAGGVFLSDSGNNRVRRVAPDGTIVTVAGSNLPFYAGDGGPATDAGLGPQGLAVGPNGVLYIADLVNRRIRMIGGWAGPVPAPTATPTTVPTATSTPSPTVTSSPTPTFTATASATPTATPCPGLCPAPPPPSPVLASSGGTTTTVRASLLASPGTPYTLTFYSQPNCSAPGTGAVILASVAGTTDGAGTMTLTAVLNVLAAPGQFVVATASGPLSAPSAYSACAPVMARHCPDDTLCNGYTDAAKIALGKDPFTYCTAMRADVNNDGSVNVLDLATIASAFGQTVPPAAARLDQNGDKSINVLDLSIVASQFAVYVSSCP